MVANADILQRGAGVVLPRPGVYAVVLLGDDTALLKFVEREATIGGDVAVAFVFAQQLETLALQTTALAVRCRQQEVFALVDGARHRSPRCRWVRGAGCGDGGRRRDRSCDIFGVSEASQGERVLLFTCNPLTRLSANSSSFTAKCLIALVMGALLKLGIDIGQTTVAKYVARGRRPPSQGWKTFLHNHADGIASIDLFVVPTISFRLLYGLLLLHHDRRQILWLGVTAHPTAEWISHQLTEAYGWKVAPRYIIRDRDAVYGDVFIRRLRAMSIRDQPTAPRSPWQNGYCERAIGSIRRECLDHVVVFGERHLRHLLRSSTTYYNAARTHL